jgi:hypothetical protein
MALGDVTLTVVVENRDPLREMVWPGVGCCWQAPLRAITTLGVLVRGDLLHARHRRHTVIDINLVFLLGQTSVTLRDSDGAHECTVAVGGCRSIERIELNGVLNRLTCGTVACQPRSRHMRSGTYLVMQGVLGTFVLFG